METTARTLSRQISGPKLRARAGPLFRASVAGKVNILDWVRDVESKPARRDGLPAIFDNHRSKVVAGNGTSSERTDSVRERLHDDDWIVASCVSDRLDDPVLSKL